MNAIKFVNANGQVRWQPELPDGRRLYDNSAWRLPYAKPKRNGDYDTDRATPWHEPTLYRSRKRAERKALAYEAYLKATTFREAK